MGNFEGNFNHQQSLDSLLEESQLHLAQYDNNELQFPNMWGQLQSQELNRPLQHSSGQSQVYSKDTPAQQHEKLSYMKNKANHLPERNGEKHNPVSQDTFKKSSSFLDDQFSSTVLNDSFDITNNVGNNSESFSTRGSITNSQNFGDGDHSHNYREVSLDQPDIILKQEDHRNTGPDFLFQQGDDAMFSFADELSSSVGSSINSEWLGSSLSSSFSFQPQSLNGPSSSANANISSHLSPNLKSPASSVRASSYLSTSLRNGYTPGTPKSRHASLSSNINGETLYSSSVPRNLSHLSAEEKLRRKRDFHNAVERRRRELIKQKIKELGKIVPPSLLNFNVKGKQVKPNKGIILNRTVEYLEYLLYVLEVQDRKKTQLMSKVEELEKKKRTQQISTSEDRNMHAPPSPKDVEIHKHLTMENKYEGVDTDVSQGRIIDGRAKPQPFSNTDRWDSETSIYNSLTNGNFGSNNDSNNHINEDLPTMNDDLKQFLSGDLIEAEDNAKLLFNSGQSSADYLLEFDT